MDDGGDPGRLLIIGGAEDRCCGSGVLERFVRLSGASKARLVLVTTATGQPGQVLAEYEQVFRKLGVRNIKELPISGRAAPTADAACSKRHRHLPQRRRSVQAANPGRLEIQ